MSRAMPICFRIPHWPLATLATLLAMLVAGGTANAAAATNTVPHFPTPASALPQRNGANQTSTAVTRSQSAPTLSIPHIATTNPQSATTVPATGQSLGAPGASTGTSTVAPATPGGTSSTPATTLPQTTGSNPAGAAAAGRPGTVRAVNNERTSLSAGAIVAAVLAALLIIVCLVWGFARWYAYEPHWTLSLRHSLAEAGLRMSSTWEELADWARLGR